MSWFKIAKMEQQARDTEKELATCTLYKRKLQQVLEIDETTSWEDIINVIITLKSEHDLMKQSDAVQNKQEEEKKHD